MHFFALGLVPQYGGGMEIEMIKKFTAALSAAIIALSAVNVYAEDTLKVERISFSPVNGSLTVSGSCGGAKDKIQILEQVIDADGRIIAAAQTSVKASGFVIENFLLPENLATGDYSLNVSMTGGENVTVGNAFYYGGRNEAMRILNSIDRRTTTSEIDSDINSGNRVLGFLDYGIYDKCKSKDRILKEFIDMDLAVDESNLAVKWESFLNRLSKNTLLAWFSDTTDAGQIKKLVENKEYFNAMGMTETDTYKRLSDSVKETAYKIMAADEASTLEGAYTIFKKGCLLAYLKNCRYTEIEAAFRENSDIISIDYTSYDKLTQSKKSNVLNLTMKYIQNSNDIAAIGRYFESEALKALKNDNEEKDGGGNGSGGGGGYSYGSQQGRSDGTGSDTNASGVQFSDLSSVPWAYEAITALANKGVISGVADGIFSPNDNVTRAQFCKMVSLCFNVSAEGEASFNDVAEDSWYKEYVIKLANAGIITGIGNGSFAPDSYITRQDIAVILVRLINKYGYEIPSLEESTVFSDDSEIAGYAKEAMYTLNGCGILTGADNRAMPHDNATRAQAAALIYRTEVARW